MVGIIGECVMKFKKAQSKVMWKIVNTLMAKTLFVDEKEIEIIGDRDYTPILAGRYR